MARLGTALRLRPVDALVALACIPPTFVAAIKGGGEVGAVHLVAVLVSIGLVLVRRRFPIPALGGAVVATPLLIGIDAQPSGILVALIVLVFWASFTRDRRSAVGAAAVGTLSLLVSVAVSAPRGLAGPEVLAALAWPGLAAASGDVLRTRREQLAAAEERARHAEETREQEARRRVAEERLHIARELHDIVAHRMAVVNVQAGVAEHLLRSQPEVAAEALRTVRAATQAALDELGGIVGVLRSTSDDPAPRGPTPTLDDLGSLVASFSDAGARIEYETTGPALSLGPAAELAVYRTVQEALTNAHRHGAGPIRLGVTHRPGGVDVEVSNAVGPAFGQPGAPTAGGGHGLVGMRERVVAAGGWVEAGAGADGRFRVRAHVPGGER